MSKLLTTILPSLLAGGLLFGSALTDAQPAPPAPPRPPAAPAPAPAPAPGPKPPKPPKPPKVKADVIDFRQIDEMVDEQIQNALEAISSDPQIPAHVREAVKQRLEKVRAKVKTRLAKIGPRDLEALGEELGNMGEEIGEEMEKFGDEMEKWSKQFEKDLDKKLEKQMKVKMKHFGPGQVVVQVDHDDEDDEDDIDGVTDLDDMDDLGDAMKDLGKLKLDARQRADLKRLRQESDAAVQRAKAELDRASEQLRNQLENANVSDQEITRSIDRVTRIEADIRKARILAWVNARRLLDDGQRKSVEAAARGRSR